MELPKRAVLRLCWLRTLSERKNCPKIWSHQPSTNIPTTILEDIHLPKIRLSTQPFESVFFFPGASQNNEGNYLYGRPPPQRIWRSVTVDLVGISWFNGLNLVSTFWDMPISSSSMVTGYPLQPWARGLFTRRNQRSKSGDRTREGKVCAKWGWYTYIFYPSTAAMRDL